MLCYSFICRKSAVHQKKKKRMNDFHSNMIMKVNAKTHTHTHSAANTKNKWVKSWTQTENKNKNSTKIITIFAPKSNETESSETCTQYLVGLCWVLAHCCVCCLLYCIFIHFNAAYPTHSNLIINWWICKGLVILSLALIIFGMRMEICFCRFFLYVRF